MFFRTLGLMLLVTTQLANAQGRGPAVEDFVGIEIEHPEGTPQGTEGLFNFEKDMDKFEQTKGQAFNSTKTDTSSPASSAPSPVTAAVTFGFILGLPALIWFMMMNHLKQKAHVASASNIEVLEKYRRERQEAKKVQEEYKKAS